RANRAGTDRCRVVPGRPPRISPMSLHPSSQGRRAGLQLEALEDRCLPTTGAYVSSLYQDILHRVPSAPEVAGWTALLNSGSSPQEVALQFTSSPEALSNVVQGDYQHFLGRSAPPSEVAGWVGALQSGVSEAQVATQFLSSAEYFKNHGN